MAGVLKVTPACDEVSPQDPERVCDLDLGHHGQCWSMGRTDHGGRPVLWWWAVLQLPPEDATREQLEVWLDA